MSPAKLATPAGKSAGARAFGLSDLGLTYECLGSARVGFGTVLWLQVGPTASALRTLTRSRAEGAGQALHIGETGQVPEIQVENRGGDPLLLPAHLVLAGGWQTRAVERSVVVSGGASVRVPVKCVEAGRWAPRDDQTARSFEVEGRTSVRTRWSTARSMAEQLTRHGRFAAEQSTVWQHIDEELTRGAVQSRTRSYEAYLQGVKRRLVAEVRRAAVRPPLAANGAFLYLPASGGFWIEAFPTPEALSEVSDDLLADLFDPDGVVDAAPVTMGGPPQPPPSSVGANVGLEQMMEWVDDVWKAPLHRLAPIAGTGGETFAMSDPERAAGGVVVLDGALAHLAVGAGPAGSEVGISGDRPRPVTMGGPVAMGGAVAMGGPERSPQTPPASVGGASVGGTSTAGRGSATSESVNDRPRVDLETMRSIFGRARDLLPEGPPARERVQGYRLVRVLDRNISWVDVRITGDGYAVLGSHDRCDLVLSNDAGIWLRHMAALCVRLEDDTVGLRLIDLKTDLPFFLDEDTPRWSVLARGPFAMRLGRHVICGFPIGAATEGAGQGALAAARAPASARPAPDARRPVDAMATGVLESGLSVADAAAALQAGSDARPAAAPGEPANLLPGVPVSQIQDLLGPSASPDHIRVTLERGGMGASVELPAEALDAGILLGRALNCFDGGLRRIFCEAISRAHVLLVRDRDGVWAFDLCSTNGTRVSGQRIRRHRLSDAGTTLELGKKVVFRWHR